MRKFQDWSAGEVKLALEVAGYCLRDVDRENGLDLGTAGNALRFPHFRAETAISKALNVSPAKIWPSRYSKTGERKEGFSKTYYAPVPRFRKRQKANTA